MQRNKSGNKRSLSFDEDYDAINIKLQKHITDNIGKRADKTSISPKKKTPGSSIKRRKT